jgi:hypothetical protein
MSPEKHTKLVRAGILAARTALLLAVLVQLVFNLDFRGLPFLFFGILVGALALTLPMGVLWKKLPS